MKCSYVLENNIQTHASRANFSNRPARRIFGQTANYFDTILGGNLITEAQLVADPRMLCDDVVHSVDNMITCTDSQLAITIQ